MGIVYVEPLFAGRRGRDGIERRRDYVQVYEVRTDSPLDDPTVAGGTALLPRNGDPYPSDSAALLISIEPVQHDNDPTLWTIACNYSTQIPLKQAREAISFNPTTGSSVVTPSGMSPAGREENPLARPTIWSGDDELIEVDVTRGRLVDLPDEVDIVNAVGDPFLPAHKDQAPTTVLVAVKNYATIDLDVLDSYKNAVNSVPFFGFAERTWRLRRAPFQAMTENNVNFFQVQYHFAIRVPTPWDGGVNDVGQGWDLRVRNIGYRTAVGLVYTDIRNPVTGETPNRPSDLSASGNTTVTPDQKNYRTYRYLKEKDFNLLGL